MRGPKRRDCDAGIVELMAAGKFRQRYIEQPIIVLIDQATVLLVNVPVFARNTERRVKPHRASFDHGERIGRL